MISTYKSVQGAVDYLNKNIDYRNMKKVNDLLHVHRFEEHDYIRDIFKYIQKQELTQKEKRLQEWKQRMSQYKTKA